MDFDEVDEVDLPSIDRQHEYIISGNDLIEILDVCNEETIELIIRFLERRTRYDAELDPRIEVYSNDDTYQVYFDDVCVYEYRGEDAKFEAISTRLHQMDDEDGPGFLIKSPHGWNFISTDEKPKGFHVRCASEEYRKQEPYPALVRLKDKCLQN